MAKEKAAISATFATLGKPPKVSLMTRLNVRLSHTEQLLLTKYLSVLLQSGLAIDDAIDILLQQGKGPLKTILTRLREAVRSGRTLASGLQEFPHVFSSVYVNLIAAGEASGTLQKNLEHLANQMQKEHELRQKIRGALMYPTIVFLMAIGISTGIVVFVLPNITSLFASLGVPLPWTTKALLWLANLFQFHGSLIGLGLIAATIGFAVIRQIAFFHPVLHWCVLHFPVVGKISRNTNLARITRLFGTLLQSGMPISDALPVTISVVKNIHYRRLFTTLLDDIGKGQTIAHAFESQHYLVPPIASRLIRVGEETGTLGDMLLYLSGFYEQEVDDATKNATTLLEPLMIVGIGLMVAVLAFSIISPIYKVVGSI